jgi:hypothetical protein
MANSDVVLARIDGHTNALPFEINRALAQS